MCCLRFDVLSDMGGFHVNVIKNSSTAHEGD